MFKVILGSTESSRHLGNMRRTLSQQEQPNPNPKSTKQTRETETTVSLLLSA